MSAHQNKNCGASNVGAEFKSHQSKGFVCVSNNHANVVDQLLIILRDREELVVPPLSLEKCIKQYNYSV